MSICQQKKLHCATKILDRLKTAKEYHSDVQLASFLKKDPSTISTWRKRDSIDYSVILAKCHDINANYLFYGELPVYKKDIISSEQFSTEDLTLNNLPEKEKVYMEKKIYALEAKIEILKEILIYLKE